MKKKFHSFSRRLTRRIILVMLVVMTITSMLVFIFSAAGTATLINEHYNDILGMTGERVEGMLKVVEVSSANNVAEIQQHLSNPQKVEAALESELRLNPHIIGCAMAFAPDYFTREGRWFEPYASYQPDGTIAVRQIGSEKHDYMSKEWYINGLEADTGYWSEPYFDEAGAGDMICTYVLPVRDNRGRLAGAFGADLSLAWLTERIQELELNDESFGFFSLSKDDIDYQPAYSFILGRSGDYLVHPDSTRILKDNFFNHVDSKSKSYEELGRNMLSGKSGGKITKVDSVLSYVFYAPLEHTGWSMGIVVPSNNIWAPGLVLGLLMLFLLGAGLLLAFFLIRSTIKRTAKPLKFLVRSAEEVSEGHFDTPLPKLRYYDEIHQLRDSFEHMQISLAKYVEELTEATSRQASIERELDIARNIQMSMLPESFPAGIGRGNVDVAGRLTPAKAVGGDIYDFFISGDNLFFCIGDVSGKGVPAAIVMAVTGTLFRTLAISKDSPGRIMNELNASLCSRNDSLMFVTLFVGILNMTNGSMTYCNAGHNAPIVLGPDGKVDMLEVEPNVAVGVVPDFKYNQQESSLVTGATLLLYTDGLTEAENTSHGQFGEERILNVLRGENGKSPAAIIDTVSDAVRDFTAGAEQSDDLTLLAIRCTPMENLTG